jgi:hypothetical protein
MSKQSQNKSTSSGKKTRVRNNPETSVKLVKQVGPAPRRRNRRGGARGTDGTRNRAIANNSKITPVQALTCAPGTKNTIEVQVMWDTLSLYVQPCGLLSMAMARGLVENAYGAYKVLYNDFTSLAKGNNGTAPSRFRFQNDIYGSIVPKTVSFRLYGTLKMSAQDFDNTPVNVIGVHNGKTYYIYNPSGNAVGAWNVQLPPPVTTSDQDVAVYNQFQTLLSGKEKHQEVIRNIQLTPKYLKDLSAYARYDPYYGTAGGVGGPYGSIELEVPFRSKLLGTFLPFNNATPRASRMLDKISGDACSNYAIGMVDGFKTSYYQGAVPPIYKFLDIAEVAGALALTVIAAFQSYLQTNQVINDDNAFVLNGFPFSYNVFLLMLRQQIIWMFADSQSLGQFMTFETGVTSFQAFLCGTNCAPRDPPVKINIPTVLNENLKMLKMFIRSYETKEFARERNHIIHIPVWGAYNEYADPNYQYNNGTATIPLFAAPISDEPDLFDGSLGNDVADLNEAQPIMEAIVIWNDWMNVLTNVIAGLDPIGGDSNGSALLQLTRYVSYGAIDAKRKCNAEREFVVRNGQRVPHMYKHMVRERKTIIRENSKSKEVVKIEQVVAIPDSTIYVETSLSISSLIPITPTHKQMVSNFILPIIDLSSANGLPSQTQIQVSSLEIYSMYKSTLVDSPFLRSRADEIQSAVANYVVGVAGKPTALSVFISSLIETNQL